MRRILVVPHGTGIGDAINIRPLVDAVIAHCTGAEVSVLTPPHLAWLLPPGARPVAHDAISKFWRRPDRQSWFSGIGRRADARMTGPMVRALSPDRAARILTRLLRRHGYEVISLLETFSRLDLDSRWTPGRWSHDRRHVIDLLADSLAERGIVVPHDRRRPVLEVPSARLGPSPVIVLNPHAGSSLKEPPFSLWTEVTTALMQSGIVPYILTAPGRDTAEKVAAHVAGVHVLAAAALPDVASVLAGADLVVSPDSGILHLAAAVGSPYLGLFGSTDPLFLGPYGGEGGIIMQSRIVHGDVCRGCWTVQMLPVARCAMRLSPGCVARIPAIEVVEAIRQRVNARTQAAIPHDNQEPVAVR